MAPLSWQYRDKVRQFLPRNYRQTSAAAALRLHLVHRHPRNEQRPILDFICLLLRKRVHSSGKLPLCGVIKGTGSAPKLATTSPFECVCLALWHILTSAWFLSPSEHTQGLVKQRLAQEAMFPSTVAGESKTGMNALVSRELHRFLDNQQNKLLHCNLGFKKLFENGY